MLFVHVPTVFGASITLTPIVSAGLEYTDNLFLSNKDKQEEFITTFSLELRASIREKLRGLEVSYKPEYAVYGKYDENNTLRHDATLRAWNDFDKYTRLEFVNRFLLTEDPLGEDELVLDQKVVLPGDTTNRKSRDKYYQNTSILSLAHQFGRGDSIRAGFLYSFLNNDDPSVKDNKRYEPSLSLAYWFNPEYGTEANVVYTVGKFDQESDSLSPSEDFENWSGSLAFVRRWSKHLSFFLQYAHTRRYYDEESAENVDYVVHQPAIGFSYTHEKRLDLKLALGYFYQDLDDGGDEDGFTLDGTITRNWLFKRGRVTVDFNSGLDQNDFGAESVGLEYYASLGCVASYSFYRNLTGEILGRVRYSDPIGNDSEGSVGKSTRYSLGPGMSYAPYRWLSMDLRYQYNRYNEDSQSGVEGGDYSENRVWLEIVLRSELPWRF